MSVGTEMVLVVEACDLDTDERTVAKFSVSMPVDEVGQRSQLARAVAQLHPDARIRSFDRGAASFTDSGHLVVAHYATIGEPVPHATQTRARREQGPLEQQSLFA